MSTLLLFSVTAFSGEDSGGGAYQRRAQENFDKLNSVQAWSSKKFDKQVENIALPGASTYVKATGLCLAGDSLQTKHKIPRACVTWSYRDSDGNRRTTTNAAEANRKDGRCIANGASRIITSPINYSVEVNVWGARDDDGKVRVYKSRSAAADKGTPILVDTRTVSKRLPTTFKVKYYRDTASGRFQQEKFVGSHRYGVNNCN